MLGNMQKATAQIALMVFADTQNANPKKPKELFFANARLRVLTL